MATREREVAPPEFFDLATLPPCPAPTLAVGAASLLSWWSRTTALSYDESVSRQSSPPLITRPFLSFYFLFSRARRSPRRFTSRFQWKKRRSRERAGARVSYRSSSSWIEFGIVHRNASLRMEAFRIPDKNWISSSFGVVGRENFYREDEEPFWNMDVVCRMSASWVKSMEINCTWDRCANGRCVAFDDWWGDESYDNEYHYNYTLDRNLLYGKK